MANTTDKPTDIMDEKHIDNSKAPQTPAQEKLAQRVQELFRASFNSKVQLDLLTKWAQYDDYKHGRQNPQQNEDHPGSVTNIIHPIIESQIADLVDKPFSVEAKGVEPSDELYAEQVKHMIEWVLHKNNIKTKINVAEHDRLELGTCVIKVFTDPDGLDGKGLPSIDIVSPANFFHDPKVQSAHQLQKGEMAIHALPMSLSDIRRQYPKLGKYVVRETSVPYDPEQFTDQKSDEVSPVTSQKALLLEAYIKDENGEVYCVHVANNIVLEDSREVLQGADGESRKLQRKDKFPFVMIPCYIQRGHAWGQGDVEILIPTQDIINELDDQIRMNARLMGNPQVVIGMGAGKGFDYRKWTAKQGLRIPMRDHNAWKIVPPATISRDVPERREKGFQEANIISGRPDVNRGEAPGQITAASAIVALQQAGQKSTSHKSEMFKAGWSEVLELLLDEIKENWTDEMWVRIQGDKPDYKFYDPRKLNAVPIMIPNAAAGPNEDTLMKLTEPVKDEQTGEVVGQQEMTREAQFDLKLTMGNGLPYDKAFIYQTLNELAKVNINGQPLISWKEFRDYLREEVGVPLDSNESVMPPMPPGMPALPGMPPGPPQGMPLAPMPMMGGVPGA